MTGDVRYIKNTSSFIDSLVSVGMRKISPIIEDMYTKGIPVDVADDIKTIDINWRELETNDLLVYAIATVMTPREVYELTIKDITMANLITLLEKYECDMKQGNIHTLSSYLRRSEDFLSDSTVIMISSITRKGIPTFVADVITTNVFLNADISTIDKTRLIVLMLTNTEASEEVCAYIRSRNGTYGRPSPDTINMSDMIFIIKAVGPNKCATLLWKIRKYNIDTGLFVGMMPNKLSMTQADFLIDNMVNHTTTLELLKVISIWGTIKKYIRSDYE